MLPKVYLAKSNKANPDLVAKTRQILSKFNIEIVEFTGGTYSHDKMLECDMLVVVPFINSNGTVVIGKGLYDQMEAFEETIGDEYVCVISNPDNFIIRQVKDIDVINDTDYINYAYVHFMGHGDELELIFEDVGFSLKPKSEIVSLSVSNSSYYVLIARKK
jgi:hypothetical protein